MASVDGRRVVAHVFVDDLAQPELAEADRHHLQRVLRLRAGELITASDGQGRWRRCSFASTGNLDIEGEIAIDERPSPSIGVGFALVKGERPELIVQKLTELGVDRILPFRAERSVVRLDDERAARQHHRWTAVAREAAMQSRRTWLPAVEPLAEFADVAEAPGAAMADRGGASPNLHLATLLVGPEGGWSDGERLRGLPFVGLGAHVLRAETGAIVAGALLAALRSGLVNEVTRGR